MVAGVIVFPCLAHVVKWVEDTTRENSYASRKSFNKLQKRGMVSVKRRQGEGWSYFNT